MIHIGPLQPGDMDKHVFVTSVWSDEAKAALVLKDFMVPLGIVNAPLAS